MPGAVRKQLTVHGWGRGFSGAGLGVGVVSILPWVGWVGWGFCGWGGGGGVGVCGTPKVRGPAVQGEGSAASGSEGALCQRGRCAGRVSLLPDQEVRLPWRGMCCE